MERVGRGTVAFRVPRLVYGVIHFSSLLPASLYRISFTVVLPGGSGGGRGRGVAVGLSSICVNVSLTVSTAPGLPARPSPPSQVLDFRNGSVLVFLSSEHRLRRRRDYTAPVTATRLIVIEYTDVVVGLTLWQLVKRGLVDTYDSRVNDCTADYDDDYDDHDCDLLVGYEDALARNQSFYVTGEVGLNSTEFLIGSGLHMMDHDHIHVKRSSSPVSPVYSNPVIDVSRPVSLYVVRQNSLDGIHRRAVSDDVVLGVGGMGAAPVVPAVFVMRWWWWIVIFFAVLGIVAIIFLPVLIFWRVYWRRPKDRRDKPHLDPAAGVKIYAPQSRVYGAEGRPGSRSHPHGAGTLAVSYLDTMVENRRRHGGRVTGGRRGFDSYSDADGDWSFVEPRPVYDHHSDNTSPGAHRRRSHRRSHSVPVSKLREHCEQYLWTDNGRALVKEFHRLPDDFTGLVTVATRPGCIACNRVQDCVPYDHNRVQLTSGQYVNASLVQTIGRRHFIVTQSPTSATLQQFWQLVWERNVDVIVALVAVDEPDCQPYWPSELNRPATAAVPGGDMTVELAGAGVLAHFAVRELLVERSGQRRRRIAHWQYTWWCGNDADTSIPCHPVDFVDFVQRVRSDDDYSDTSAVLVHCGCGGGRSGLYLAVDALLDQGSNTGVVDVLKCVSVLRTQRCGLVRSLRQYNFIYQCLCEQFDHPATRFSADELVFEPQVDEYDLVFMPVYFSSLLAASDEPARRRSGRSPYSLRPRDEASKYTAESSSPPDRCAADDVDENPAVTFDGFIQRSLFVVSQCPRPLDADGFWDVVTESQVSCIVSLGQVTSLVGHELVIPQVPGCSINTQHHLVQCQSFEKNLASFYVSMELDVSTSDGPRVVQQSRRSVKLFQLVSWSSDCSVPGVDAMLEFVALVRCWQRRSNSPLLVFGSARPAWLLRDRSRAAVFTTLWRLMEQAELDAVVDVFAAARLTCLLLPSAIINEEQYRFLYAAMKEFLVRPDAYVLGRDCRAFPPTSLAQRQRPILDAPAQQHADTQPGPPLARQLARPTDSVWSTMTMTMTSPGSVSGGGGGKPPWLTPGPALASQPGGRGAIQGAGGEWRRPGLYQRQAAVRGTGAGRYAKRSTSHDAQQLNVSMNRVTTTNDEELPELMSLTSSSPDVKQQQQQPVVASAAQYPPAQTVPTTTANDQFTTGADDDDERLATTTDQEPTTDAPMNRRAETLMTTTATSGPATSTPVEVDHP